MDCRERAGDDSASLFNGGNKGMKTTRLLMACSFLALAGAAGAEDLKTAIDKDYP